MPLFLLSYRQVDQTVIGFAIVEALDGILARRVAKAANIHWPGALCTVAEIDPGSVPPALVGRRLALEDFAVKKPPAPSARRAARAPAAPARRGAG